MKWRYGVFGLLVMVVVGSTCLIFFRDVEFRSTTITRTALDQLVQSGKLLSGTVVYRSPSSLIEVSGRFRDSDGHTQQFYIKTARSDELVAALLTAGFVTAESAESGVSLFRRIYLRVGDMLFSR